ncbi:hypothetical protein SARC_13671, partial [Sphaeroforma arctica JP610]
SADDLRPHQPLGETTGKTNGWSGHWYYIMYQFLTVHYSALLLMGPVGSYSTTAGKSNASQTRSVYLLLPFYTAVALLINGMATWVYGYHSLQQCFLGSVSVSAFASTRLLNGHLYLCLHL